MSLMIISLDQNAASYLAKAQSGEWSKLRHLLSDGFAAGLVVCPMPLETFVESAACDEELRRKIDAFFEAAGGRIAFRVFTDILADATLKLVRPRHKVRVFCRIKGPWAHRVDSAFSAVAVHRHACDDMIAKVATHTHVVDACKMSFEQICKSSAQERCGYLYRDLGRFIESSRRAEADYELKWLMRKLIASHFTTKEAEALREAILLRRWEGIPENFIEMQLGSRWEHDRLHRQRPKYDPNDDFDRWRAAVALTNADAFVTDNYAADLCRRAGTARYPCADVFSVSQVGSILKWVNEALASTQCS